MNAGVTITVRSATPATAAQHFELVHQMAAACASAGPDPQDACPFVIRTEMRTDGVVKTVVFDRPEAAQRFRTLLRETAPQLRADD